MAFKQIKLKLPKSNSMKDENDSSRMIENTYHSRPLEDLSNSMNSKSDEIHQNEIKIPKQRFHRLMTIIRGKKPSGF